MKKYLLPAILLMMFIQGAPFVYGQSRNISLEFIINKFNTYCGSVPWEEVYVHTDREEYIAGEQIWFKIYVIDRQSIKPSLNSRIVYVELINMYGNPVIRRSIKVDNGSGPGEFILPDSLSSGTYTFKAYTNRMKNFLPGNCFLKEIKIYNTIRDQVFKEKPVLSDRDKEAGTHSLFREEEFMLRTLRNIDGSMDLAIHTTNKFRSRYGNIFFVLTESRGNTGYAAEIRIAEDSTGINIPRKYMAAGINHITLFSSSGDPIYERYIYAPEGSAEMPVFNIPESCSSRERVFIEEHSGSDFSLPMTADLSISAAPAVKGNSFPGISDYMVFGTEFGPLPDSIRNRPLNEFSPREIDKFLLTLKSNWIDWSVILSEKLPVLNYGFETRYHYLTGRLVNRTTMKGGPNRFLFLSSPSKTPSFQYAVTDSSGNFLFCIPVTGISFDLVIQPAKPEKVDLIMVRSPFAETQFQDERPSLIEKDTPDHILEMSSNYQVGKIYEIITAEYPEEEANTEMASKRFYGKPDIELIMDDYIKLPVMQEVFFELIQGVSLKKRKSDYEIIMNDPLDDKPYNTPPGLFVDGVFINDPSLIAAMDPEAVEKIDVINEAYYIGDYFFEGIINIITRNGDLSDISLPENALRIPLMVTQPAGRFVSPDYSGHQNELERIPDSRNTIFWDPSVKPGPDGRISVEFWSSDHEGSLVLNIEGIGEDGSLMTIRKIINVTDD
ncbi:MAG: hypothetical protein V1903_03420 [Bacteroidota bacterium]